MGQRLVIQNFTPFQKENQEEIFPTNAIYYHWSAYTESAIDEIKQLKEKVEEYYNKLNNYKEFHNNYNSNSNKVDFFNLACLNAVSGIAPQYEKSVKYIKNLLEEPYDTTKVNRNDGMIGFTEDDIDHIQYWSEGTVNIYWVFDEEGKPDFEKSTFDFWALLSSDTTEDYKDWYSKSDAEIEEIKKIKCDVDIQQIPLSEVETILDQLPEEFYEPDEDRIYTYIG